MIFSRRTKTVVKRTAAATRRRLRSRSFAVGLQIAADTRLNTLAGAEDERRRYPAPSCPASTTHPIYYVNGAPHLGHA